jgi:hypothetical protein
LASGMSIEEVAERSGRSVEILKLMLGEMRQSNKEVHVESKPQAQVKVGRDGYNISARARELYSKGLSRGEIKRIISHEIGRQVSDQQIYQATNYKTPDGVTRTETQGRALAGKTADQVAASNYRIALAHKLIPDILQGLASGKYSKKGVVNMLYKELRMELPEIYAVVQKAGINMSRTHIYNNCDLAIKARKAEDPSKICQECGRPLTDPFHQEEGMGPRCLERKFLKGELRPKQKVEVICSGCDQPTTEALVEDLCPACYAEWIANEADLG